MWYAFSNSLFVITWRVVEQRERERERGGRWVGGCVWEAQILLKCEFSHWYTMPCLLVVWARHYVPSGKGTLYAWRNGHEWLHCWDKQIKYSDTHKADGQSILDFAYINACSFIARHSWSLFIFLSAIGCPSYNVNYNFAIYRTNWVKIIYYLSLQMFLSVFNVKFQLSSKYFMCCFWVN